jgi:hypothetical protein
LDPLIAETINNAHGYKKSSERQNHGENSIFTVPEFTPKFPAKKTLTIRTRKNRDWTMVPFVVFIFASSQSPSSSRRHGHPIPADQPSSIAIAVAQRRKGGVLNARGRGDIEVECRANIPTLLGFLGLAHYLLRLPA